MNDYDSEKLPKFITHLDLNNLYNLRLSSYLPYGGFKWLKYVDGFDVNSVSEKSIFIFNIFLKLTLNILMNYMNYAMIIH